MPIHKDFKRLVRTRMQKTGESYTSARARLLKQHARRRPTVPPAVPLSPPGPADYARRAGMSDAAIKAKTGCTWKRWADALDSLGARDLPHREIAELVQKKFKVDGWWAQTVTVGYERIRGLRELGQRRGGGYETSKSKTIAAPVAALYRAFADGRHRKRWLPGVTFAIRTATPAKSMRLAWEDGSLVQLHFTQKADTRSQISVQHTKLPDQAARERMKAYWSDRLAALAAWLSE